MAKPCFKPIILGPLTGPLDVRSQPDMVAPGSFRWSQNFQTTEKGVLCRRPGFERLFREVTPYGNQDLHDQLLSAQFYMDGATLRLRSNGREPITTLFPVDSISGWRTLLAGTHSRLYEQVESVGNWRILGDGFGGPTTAQQYWSMAALGNTIIATNNFDPPQSYVLGADVDGDDLRRTRDIDDLAEVGITAAKIAIQFAGVMLLMNLEQDGARRANRIHWSNANQPLSWAPAADSIANYQDLSPDEEILAAAPLGGALIVYTDKAIWRLSLTGTTQVFSAQAMYVERQSRDKCLLFPRTLVSTGFSHYYMARGGIYEWNGFLAEPSRPQWLHTGTGVIYNDLDTSCCESPAMWYCPEAKELRVSWPQLGQGCVNSRTFVFAPEYQTSSVIDQGFSAACNYTSDPQILLRDWISLYCLCTPASQEATAGNFTKEGGSTNLCGGWTCSQPFTPTSLRTNADPITIDGRLVENPDAIADSESLCTLLAGTEPNEWCAPCSTQSIFIAASTTDLCLKQWTQVYSREFCSNPSDEGQVPATQDTAYCSIAGEYVEAGYYSILRGIFPFGKVDNAKLVRNALIEVTPAEQLVPCAILLRLGGSYRAVDSNAGLAASYGITEVASFPSGKCCPNWKAALTKPLECLDEVTMDEMREKNWKPDAACQWPVWMEDRYMHFEITIANADGTPAIGGAACFSSLHLETQLKESC